MFRQVTIGLLTVLIALCAVVVARADGTPTPGGDANTLLQQGIDKLNNGDFDGAIADFDKAIAIDPTLEAAYVRRGNARYGKADYDNALADYAKAVQLNPNDAIASFNICNTQYQRKAYQDALTACNTALKLDPTYSPAFDSRGLVKNLLGDLDGAIADDTQAIAINKQDVIAWRNRGLAYQKKGNLSAALADFDQAITINPNYVDAYYSRGIARDAMKDTAGASADFQKVLDLAPDFPDADNLKAYLNQFNTSAWLPVLSGLLIAAITFTVVNRRRGGKPRFSFFMALIQAFVVLLFAWGVFFTLTPHGWQFQINTTPILFLIAISLFGGAFLASVLLPMYYVRKAIDSGAYDRALRYARWSRWSPGSIGGFMQGTALTALGRFDEAIPLLRKAAEHESRGTSAKDTLAWALYYAGQDAEAAQLFQESLTRAPNGLAATHGLAEIALTQGEGARALTLLDGLKSERSGILEDRAWALAMTGNCLAAQKIMGEAAGQAVSVPDRAARAYRAAQVWALCGNTAKATESLREAVKIDPHGIYGLRAAKALG
jgi:tetratricopeptide (TPR) repeat protein